MTNPIVEGIPLIGRIGNLIYYKTKHGIKVRMKPAGISKHRFLTDPAFSRTRENCQEFTQVSKTMALFYTAFRSLSSDVDKRGFLQKLNKAIWQVLKSDPVNCRGQRRVEAGDLQHLHCLECAFSERLNRVISLKQVQLDPLTGEFEVTLWSRLLSGLPPDTEVKVLLHVAGFDTVNGTWNIVKQESLFTPRKTRQKIHFSGVYDLKNENLLLIGLAVVFSRQGTSLKQFNMAAIIRAERTGVLPDSGA